jgi:hypothetical protein
LESKLQTKIAHQTKNFGNPEEFHTKAFKPEPKQTVESNRATVHFRPHCIMAATMTVLKGKGCRTWIFENRISDKPVRHLICDLPPLGLDQRPHV